MVGIVVWDASTVLVGNTSAPSSHRFVKCTSPGCCVSAGGDGRDREREDGAGADDGGHVLRALLRPPGEAALTHSEAGPGAGGELRHGAGLRPLDVLGGLLAGQLPRLHRRHDARPSHEVTFYVLQFFMHTCTNG